jgi:hypothetical protein
MIVSRKIELGSGVVVVKVEFLSLLPNEVSCWTGTKQGTADHTARGGRIMERMMA